MGVVLSFGSVASRASNSTLARSKFSSPFSIPTFLSASASSERTYSDALLEDPLFRPPARAAVIRSETDASVAALTLSSGVESLSRNTSTAPAVDWAAPEATCGVNAAARPSSAPREIFAAFAAAATSAARTDSPILPRVTGSLAACLAAPRVPSVATFTGLKRSAAT